MNSQQPAPKGIDVLQNPALNKATAFTSEERERYGLFRSDFAAYVDELMITEAGGLGRTYQPVETD